MLRGEKRVNISHEPYCTMLLGNNVLPRPADSLRTAIAPKASHSLCYSTVEIYMISISQWESLLYAHCCGVIPLLHLE